MTGTELASRAIRVLYNWPNMSVTERVGVLQFAPKREVSIYHVCPTVCLYHSLILHAISYIPGR